ncbi:carbon-nitrogen hydrolase [Cucurbitaria berberidis CBS 394.84]|uniref:Carbon-nitrogen hydrolase n=1 Tax=Cucurbitaria berberidis CBS 394.84 TaxID=1168544 RepID=A0A9P4GAX1_9PLEO|nr:carbon-nitrogen hydrolase [Cucurbitaria berberidis CBS 394.84]KAF1841900.1 carbon-nitrogen hydrolase [Cucurbitaria berberidis CBS 394.84]
MAAVTIGKSYFEALLRKAEFHTSAHDLDYYSDLSNNVTISKAEHTYLLQAVREYHLLKNALFRGGLTNETLETLLEGESGANDEPSQYDYQGGETFEKPNTTSITMSVPSHIETSPVSDNTAIGNGQHSIAQPRTLQRILSYGEPRSSISSSPKDDEEYDQALSQRVPVHDQRTVLITNLSERTTHKDLAGIVRGGRLLDIFLRNDRTATISFVEGASEFLAHAKRNDIYLHMKRLEFRWSDRQFHVPAHVSNKIANGATRNLVVRGIARKLTADQIRDHLDHIHNLVVVDVYFKDGDAYISTNSIHNALFARTCMMSRTAYKGTRIDYYPDECAAPLPRSTSKAHTPVPHVSMKPMPITNQYALLEIESECSSDSDDESYMTHGIRVDGHNWADTALPSIKMAPIVKVAVIQLYPKPMQLEHNFSKAANFIRSAAAQGAELAVLPEYHLTNWVPKDPGFVGLCDQWETYLQKYRDLAKECKICIVPGTIVETHRENEKEEDKLLNVCYFIDQEGNIAGKYVKKNLWGPERDHLTGSGRDVHEVFDTPIGKVGMLICWDLAFPEAFRELIANGAKIIIIPTFWTLNDCNEAGLKQNPSAEALFLDSMLTARAFENTCAIIFANAGGPPGRGYAGLSQVTVPFVGPLSKLGGCAEGMSVVDIDMQILEDAEANYEVRSDIARDDWHYDYRHSKTRENL